MKKIEDSLGNKVIKTKQKIPKGQIFAKGLGNTKFPKGPRYTMCN